MLACLGMAGCNRDPKVARDKAMASGNKYYSNGKYKEASILYRRALQLDPKYADAYYRLGLTDMELGKIADAVQVLRRAYSLDPANEDAAVRLVSIYLSAYVRSPKGSERVLEDARQVVDQLLRRNPKSYDALRLDADLATANGDNERALQKLREANAAKPWQPETTIALMAQLTHAGKNQEAQTLGEQFLEQRKDYGRVYDLLFLYAMRDSKNERGEEILKSKIANMPADAGARLQLAAFYFAKNRRPEMDALLASLRADHKNFPRADGLIGNFYVRIGEYDVAIDSFRQGETSDPKDTLGYQKRIVQLLIAQGKNKEALTMVTQMRKDNPKDAEVGAVHAMLLAREGPKELQSAIEELESLAQKYPANASIQFNLGSVYMARGDRDALDRARHCLESSISLNSEFMPAKMSLARVQLARGDYRSAVDISDEILKTAPSNPQAHLTRATGLANLGERDKARAELNALLHGRQDNEARFQLARLDFAEKRYADAESGFMTLADAGDARGILGVARSMSALGQQAGAVQLLDKEVAKFPDRDDYRMALVEVQYETKQFQQARQQLEELTRRKPDSSEVWLRLGDVKFQLGDQQGAMADFKKAHQLKPSDVRAALNLAKVLDITGQTAEASAAYEDVLRVDPGNAQAMNNWAYIKATKGEDLDQALGYAERALRSSPHDPNFSDTLALVYIRKKLSTQAVQILRELVTRMPDNPSVHMHLGMALFDTGDKLQAKRELETALRHKPSASEQATIKELVAKI